METWTLLGSDTKRQLLHLLKRRGQLTLNEAVAATGLTRPTLREHLVQLERDGLVYHTTARQRRGRPFLLYRLTSAGAQLFPNRDGSLLGRLLCFLQKEGADDLLQRFFEQYWEERLQAAQQRLQAADTLEKRLAVLRAFLEEEGFMPEIVCSAQGIEIRACNCPFWETVRHTRLPCYLEARFFEQLLGQKAVRVTYIPEGSPACRYLFERRQSSR
ncbi:helix-turn-helix transcriptional regulator [Rhodothermus profundi]|uniref:Predicted transcriptional regulator, ArsR family n=1 Tax=Rhodothermus profundi TaxID=633813 RepID=A0A1M6UIK8_9BACT|nr:ArsR family transcriptional regulator [Rhodothermus profundi]SHK69052.1 Predicted transcriptional regulator, ArsR family [Rhodothermus profundi]